MDLARYRDVIGRRWTIVVALALLGGVVTGVPAARRDPVYRAETQLLVTFAAEGAAPPQPRPSAPEAGRLMQRRVKTYATMMNTPRLTRPVIDSLRLPYTTDDLATRVVASSTVNALAIDVAVTDRSGTTAAAIADALAAELQRIARRDLPPAGLGLKAQVAVVRPAVAPQRPEPVWWPLHTLGGAFGGLAIGLGVALVLGYRRAGTPVGADLRTVWAAVRRRPVASGPDVHGPDVHGPDVNGPDVNGPESDGPEPDGDADDFPPGVDPSASDGDRPDPVRPTPGGASVATSPPPGEEPDQDDGRVASPAVKARQVP
ncbi:Capsular polysaccharide biosynthesis protein [Micromonospora sediminicola]|uniref:Capsular polysaccharide biosynthesis protein n=1 Tax=Micromonospora sediminicola TaxID=946078 RepID=A0A1A9BH76_9ACTN|nr:lipopolysaccharide biosynthesis protein [Micromonospora sediminicola]SBT68426.1 Capsular polysaccharide biosynthesis protein [Micromonospora sediminicola]